MLKIATKLLVDRKHDGNGTVGLLYWTSIHDYRTMHEKSAEVRGLPEKSREGLKKRMRGLRFARLVYKSLTASRRRLVLCFFSMRPWANVGAAL
jgi:hypothetical protein